MQLKLSEVTRVGLFYSASFPYPSNELCSNWIKFYSRPDARMSRSFRHTQSSTSCSRRFKACQNTSKLSSFFSVSWGWSLMPVVSFPTAQAQRVGKKFPNCALPRIAREKHSPSVVRHFEPLKSRCQMNGPGKDLLLCSETLPDICRATELHYAKPLKTKVY